MITLAMEFTSSESVMALMDKSLTAADLPTATDAKLGEERDTPELRRILGKLANDKKSFKNISRGERLAAIVGPNLEAISKKPLVALHSDYDFLEVAG